MTSGVPLLPFSGNQYSSRDKIESYLFLSIITGT